MNTRKILPLESATEPTTLLTHTSVIFAIALLLILLLAASIAFTGAKARGPLSSKTVVALVLSIALGMGGFVFIYTSVATTQSEQTTNDTNGSAPEAPTVMLHSMA